jgi:hypothetical protein
MTAQYDLKRIDMRMSLSGTREYDSSEKKSSMVRMRGAKAGRLIKPVRCLRKYRAALRFGKTIVTFSSFG